MSHINENSLKNKILIGRHEWCALSDLHIPAIRAKIDTGAKTSAIHAFNVSTKKAGQKTWVHFDVHPLQNNNETVVRCKAVLVGERKITSSNGTKEVRYVIETTLLLGGVLRTIELTLSGRDQLRFRLLLGREALNKLVLIDPSKAYMLGNVKNASDLYGH
ncbi:MAG: RimK/LysX family protein [Coxiellaceae bacterium]|nr:RimK/LysX family protein [Coxiellaceae bacterium]